MEFNTLFLLSNISLDEKFDLIWVDGGHLYPDVAWDLSNAYHLLNKGGYLLCDDVVKSDKYYSNGYVSTDSYEVLNYLEERIDGGITYFLKRISWVLYPRIKTRKYVALLKK